MFNYEIVFAGMPGGWEMVVIALVILLMFGAKKLPELAKGIGTGNSRIQRCCRRCKR